MNQPYDNLYMINTSTLEEICKESGLGFPYNASVTNPNRFPESQYPWHWHSYIQCFYVTKGQIDYILPSGTYRFREGDGGFINSNALHMLKAKPEITTFYVEQLFSPTFVGGFSQNDIMKKYVTPITSNGAFDIFCLRKEDPDQAELLQILKHTFDIYQSKKECYELYLRLELTRFWAEFFRYSKDYRSHLDHNFTNNKIKPMILYINENFENKITLEDIARAGSCSVRECSRVFQSNLHMTAFEYLGQLRMNKAVAMLTSTPYSITHIAESCGFSDPSHFTKVFKRIHKISPKQYRAGGKLITDDSDM